VTDSSPSDEVLGGFYQSNSNKFFLSFSGRTAGVLFSVNPQQESPEKEIKLAAKIACRAFGYSATSKYLIAGMDNGQVQVRSAADPTTVIWTGHFHDGVTGRVTHVATSFDGCYLLTVGSDANFFVLKLQSEPDQDFGASPFSTHPPLDLTLLFFQNDSCTVSQWIPTRQ
jgi:WD40 repeat protein